MAEERAHPARASRSGEAGDLRPSGTRSGGATAPSVSAKIAAETRGDGPRTRNRSLRTPSGEIPPIRSATAESDRPSPRIQAFSETILPASPALPAALPSARLAEVLAILLVDVVEALRLRDREAVLEGIANRLDRQGRVLGGSEAAVMLGAVSAALMRLER